MRMWPLTTLLTRWRADRRDRAVDAAWQADVDRAREERQILAAIGDHYERRRLGGPR
jgi:hypothetical protein